MVEEFVDKVKITVLADNLVGFRGKLFGQHGASYLVEALYKGQLKKILVDTGWNGDALLFNMTALGVEPKSIDAIIITHGHWDHTGGLVKVLENTGGKQIPIVMHPQSLKSVFIAEPFIRPVGIISFSDYSDLRKLGGYPILSRDPVKIGPGIFTTGEIERSSGFEKVEENYQFIDNNGRLVHDEILDDIALVIKLKRGIGVVTGCGHAGVVNIVKKAISLTKEETVRFILGGLHLAQASEDRISKTIEALSSFNIESIYAGHCTGLNASCALQRAFSSKFNQIYVGMSIEVS